MRLLARIALVAMTVAATTTVPPAVAKGSAAPRKFHVVARTGASVSLEWKPVRRATSYRVVVRKAKGKPHPRRLTVDTTTATFDGLTPGVRYTASVRARRAHLGPKSRTITFKTRVGDVSLRAASVGPFGVVWDWDDIPGAASYLLRMAASPSMSGYTDMAFGLSSASVRGLPNNRTFYAQVVGVGPKGALLGAWSPVASVGTPAPPALPSTPLLTVASFNIRCENCYAGFNAEEKWEVRKPAVIAQIISRRPDVIGVQEASQGYLSDGVTPQFKDLRDGLNAAGGRYEVTNTVRYNCPNPTGPSCEDSDFQYRGASLGTRVFYNTDTVDLLDSGSKLLPSADGENKRYMAWAILRQKSTDKKFFLSTVQTQYMAKYASLRQQEMASMMNEVVAKNPEHLPAFVTGDLNSTRYQAPSNAPYDEVVARGFVDPLGHTYGSPMVSETSTAEQRVRANYNSHNNFLRIVSKFAEWQNGSNLDYIFTTPMRVPVWETVLDLDGRDRLVGTIPSDHNMILIKAALP